MVQHAEVTEVKHTFMGDPNCPRLSMREHNWGSKFGNMGRCLSICVPMLRSATLSKEVTWKLFSAAVSLLSCL